MIGQTISHYEILQKLGAGGMGEIYQAQDTRLHRLVAIKVLSGARAGGQERRRFLLEAQAASSLNHPNIITIHDIVSQDDKDFMVMEYVTGKTLADLIPQGGLSVSDALRYAVQVTDALETAHAAGIIHRDLKPANIMVTESGRVKILDFGLAKLAARGPVSLNEETQTFSTAPLTVEGSIIGTVSYMSPEQARGRAVDARSDVFSFGLVLYEMVTGCKAFAEDSAISTLSAILRDEARPIEEIVPGVPVELDRIIHRALRKDPAQRWESMKEMRAALTDLKQRYDTGALAAPVAAAAQPRPASNSKWRVAAAAVVLLGGLAAGGLWWGTHRAAAPAPQPAATAVPPAPVPVETQPAEIKSTPPADSVLTNQAVVEMVQGKVQASVIISQIRSSKTKFDLSTAEIIRLTGAGVPPNVIETMRNPTAPMASAPPPPAPAATAVTAPLTPRPPSPEIAPRAGVPIAGGMPFAIVLSEDVPADAAPGRAIHFQVASDVRVGDTVVIAKGTVVLGEVVEAGKKKFLGRAGKPTYRLQEVDAVDGTKIKIRATPSRGKQGKADRPMESLGHTRSPDLAAAAGSDFLAYFEGGQTVQVRR